MRITNEALKQIKNNNQYLVVLVKVGGCKKFIYEMFFTKDFQGYLLIQEVILTDAFSYDLLKEVTLDYRTEIGYEDFIINHNFGTCKCGSSFDVF